MNEEQNVPPTPPAGRSYPAEDALPTYPTSIPTAPQVDPHGYGNQGAEWAPLRKFDFVEACGRYWKGYVRFRGRAGIAEYWTAIIAMGVAAGLVGLIPIIGQIAGLAFIIPTISYGVRRLHDANLSGWFILLPSALSVVAFFFVVKSFLSVDVTELSQYADVAATEAALSSMDASSLLIGFGLWLLSFIVHIAMMCLPPKPAGVRFD